MTKRNNSRDEWQQYLTERQQNLTPADITRTSQFRASGLSKSAPLPIAVRWRQFYVGVAAFAVGIAAIAAFTNSLWFLFGTVLGASGCFVMLSAIRWTAK